MNHIDHVNLIRTAVVRNSGTWADFGAGGGAFTLALAECLGKASTIIAVDQDAYALQRNQHAVTARFPAITTHYHTADFTHPLDLPLLDGLIIANALHFHRHKEPILHLLMSYLKPHGVFVLVEYNVDHGNQWVPFPLSYSSWAALAGSVCLTGTRQLAARPSRFLHEIYSAVSYTQDI